MGNKAKWILIILALLSMVGAIVTARIANKPHIENNVNLELGK
jgi:hypothetical protein